MSNRASIGLVVASSTIALSSMAVPCGAAGIPLGPYGLDVHITAPSYAGCAPGADAAISCATRNPNGITIGSAMWVWVFLSGVSDGTDVELPDGVGSLAFGLVYDEMPSQASWDLCTGGTQIPQDDAGGTWPESGTGVAVTWPDDCHRVTENDDGMTVVGILTIDPASTGFLDFAVHPDVGEIRAVDCDGLATRVCDERLGRADIGAGSTGGVVACDESCDLTPVAETSWGRIKSTYGY